LEKLKALVAEDPSLATSRSRSSHPTLLQCLVLEAKGQPHHDEMVRFLIDAGGDVDGALAAAASIGNRPAAELSLDRGASVDGVGGWTPLEEALYWNNKDVIALLLERGAKVQNLRTAAGLGHTDLIAGYFNADGTLKPEAGKIDWPFGNLDAIATSNCAGDVKQSLTANANSWSPDQQAIVNNAFIYACMHGHLDAAKLLIEHGAEINVIPGGFDYAGMGLHYAALNGHRAMVEFLLANGADKSIKDSKVNNTAAGWADFGGHPDLLDIL
jgi:ankyrin repeat protein